MRRRWPRINGRFTRSTNRFGAAQVSGDHQVRAQRGFPETNKAPLLNLRRASMPGFESRIDALAIHGFASHRRRTGALLIPGNVWPTAGLFWGQTIVSLGCQVRESKNNFGFRNVICSYEIEGPARVSGDQQGPIAKSAPGIHARLRIADRHSRHPWLRASPTTHWGLVDPRKREAHRRLSLGTDHVFRSPSLLIATTQQKTWSVPKCATRGLGRKLFFHEYA